MVTNQVLGPVTGTVVQAGTITYTGAPPARSRYLEWVRQIAPRELVGREAELAGLTEFCTAPAGADYVWFRAEPWAGKSALLASFVLNPPDGVRLVSFFITARSVGDDTQEAFVDAVQQQLAEILGTAKDPEARNLHAVFADAARHCRDRGERLVLVVDGLDEDRGARGHSIAALLPFPSDGLRVIVASRLNPDVPADVRAGHPLRTPGIERVLAPSTAAHAARSDMERELDALLTGETDLLGLLVAARGGLTRADLAELTRRPVRMVERALASRSFSRRPAHWRSAEAPEIYLLGHENLQRVAEDALGTEVLARHRSTMDTWAQGYREAGWPADTPQFLLRGYFRLVQEGGDGTALADLAADPRRHARLLDVSGNDLAALAELDAARAVALEAAEPDLVRIITLETYRDNFRDRNTRTPQRLPALWAQLGEVDHAVALAQSMTERHWQRIALVALVGALAQCGRAEVARQLADDEPEPELRDTLLAEIPLTLIENGHRGVIDTRLSADRRYEVEAHLAVARPDPDFARAIRRAAAVSEQAVFPRLGRLVVAAHPDLAERFVEVAEAAQIHGATLAVAAALSRRGEIARARALAERYDQGDSGRLVRFADLVTGDGPPAGPGEEDVLVDVLIATGRVDGIPAVLAAMPDGTGHDIATSRYLTALAARGDVTGATELATRFRPKSSYRDPLRDILGFLTEIAEVVLQAGDADRAREIAAETEALARRPVLDWRVADAVVALAGAAVASGDVRRVETLAPLVPIDQYTRTGMAEVLRLLAAEGDPAIAEKVLTGLERPGQAYQPVLLLARRLREAGDSAALARLAVRVRGLMDALDSARSFGWDACVTMICAVGEPADVAEVVARCREVRPDALDDALEGVAELASRGEETAALTLCAAMSGFRRRRAMTTLVKGLAEEGWADRAEVLADREADQDLRAELRRAFALGVGARDLERALAKAAGVERPQERAELLAKLAVHAGPDRRKRILAEAVALDRWSVVVPALGVDELAGLLDVADRFGALYRPEEPQR
ncbi:hypothetical protein [Amycolatopsis jejuensis]|uniref:hypothetical protein n=1 Tax=Amycolatopsis jejuensis TaxID=330084 RepID=UPI000526F4D1|nr:hypothetical protein [Amycolatopsis jejuensis]